MTKKLLFLFTFLLLMCGCKDDNPEIFEDYITPSKSIIPFGKKGGETFIKIKHNVDFVVSYHDDWVECELKTIVSKTEKNYVIYTKPHEGDKPQSSIITFRALDNSIISDVVVVQTTSPYMYEFKFEMKKNPLFLQEDMQMEIANNDISGHIKHYASTKNLIATFDTDAMKVEINGVEQKSGITPNDFSKPITYTLISDEGEKVEYTVTLTNFTGLPVVYITTEGKANISSKEDYINAEIEIDGAGQYEDFPKKNVEIRGRGNSTWGMPKKPYRLKFDKKQEVMGMPAHKSWALMANYADKSFLRYETALDMSRVATGLDWTPRTRFVELFLNGVYNGTYQLFEIIKINENRVNVTDKGFIVEIVPEARLTDDDIWFKTSLKTFVVKEPDIEQGDNHYEFIKKYINDTEEALYSNDFLNPETGYKAYVDLESFADWFLINEITKNNDAAFFASCFMNYKPEEKLKMGPVWDFDISLGNINYNGNDNPEGFWMTSSVWYSRMLQDPEFSSMVKERYKAMRIHMTDVIININNNAAYLKWSMIENNNKWNTLYHETWPNDAIWGSYSNEVQYLKNWMQARLNWLDKAIETL